MSDDVKLEAPHLELGAIAVTDDERIANLLYSYAEEPGDAAETLRWALLSLQRARASHQAIGVLTTDATVLRYVAAGLELAPE